MENQLLKEAQAMQAQLSEWRRALHQIPELGLHLPKTVDFVKEKLTEMEIDYHVYEDSSCITACIGKGNKCFLLRSDMDGLPMPEESGVSFASQNGCMHSCGHDLHTATLLGAAKLLKAHEEDLSGIVKLFFQSGEEIFAGASAAIEAGILEKPTVDAAFGMHVASEMASNIIIYGPQPMSSVLRLQSNSDRKRRSWLNAKSGNRPYQHGSPHISWTAGIDCTGSLFRRGGRSYNRTLCVRNCLKHHPRAGHT